MQTSLSLPQYVTDVLLTLESAGFEAFAVGGGVRDTLMGRQVHDWDAASSAPAEAVTALFPKTLPTGIRYGTVTVLTSGGRVEVTRYRRDGEYRDSRRPESVEAAGTLMEDLARRDFTVNAMALSARGELVDLYDGIGDIERRTIRAVGDPCRRFREDALRMLRAVRLCAELDMTLEEGTLEALRVCAPLCANLSGERLRAELCRTLDSPRPQMASLMIEYGLTAQIISNSGEKIPWEALDVLPMGYMRLAALALMLESGGYVKDAPELLTVLRCPARIVRDASEAASLKGLCGLPQSVRAALSSHSANAVLLAAAAGGFYGTAESELAAHRFVTVAELAVSGDDLKALGLHGRRIGEELARLASMATAGAVENERSALLNAALSCAFRD